MVQIENDLVKVETYAVKVVTRYSERGDVERISIDIDPPASEHGKPVIEVTHMGEKFVISPIEFGLGIESDKPLIAHQQDGGSLWVLTEDSLVAACSS
jgi:hypothetical protein